MALKGKILAPLQLTILYRMIISIFEMYRAVVVPQPPKLNTITDESTMKEGALVGLSINKAIEMLGIDISQLDQKLTNANQGAILHSSSSSGPNGPATWMSHIDAKAIMQDSEVRGSFFALSKILKRLELIFLMRSSLKLPQFFAIRDEQALHSRLHFIWEKGDKVRTIAIGDWFTQELLSPLHEVIADLNKSLDMDGTFNQDRIAEKVRLFTLDKDLDLFSYDLSSATDRLPVDLQVLIMDALFNREGLGAAWKDLMVKRNFTLPNGVKLRYAVGQPMGIKTSFPMLAFTHHVIVQMAAYKAGLDKFKEYVILGDDIMIANKAVSEQYLQLMKDFGLEISIHKSIVNTVDNRKQAIAEICKRLYLDGVEITSLPINLMANAIENQDMIYQLQNEMQKKGMIYEPSNFPSFIAGLITNQESFNRIALYNGLPTFIGGITQPIIIDHNPAFVASREKGFRGVTMLDLMQVWIFTILVEQLKRLGVLLNTTATTYDALMKAAEVSKASILNTRNGKSIHVTDFNRDMAQAWNIDTMLHPAKLVCDSEVERIAKVLMRLSVASGSDLMKELLASVIDGLKVSIVTQTLDESFAKAKMTKTLIDKTMQTLDRIKLDKENQLSYSMKLPQFNIVWTVKFKLGGTVVLSRSTSNIATTAQDSMNRLARFRNNSSLSK
nr:putative RNA-dependent RNA polymerase [Rhizoctonia solani mitovirus 28]